jgi:beta-phosphoglucomutase family hydrolase
MIEGAIFDMDGVLVDNLDYHLSAWKQLGQELGRTITDAQIQQVFGQRNREMLRALIGKDFSEDKVRQHTLRKEEIYRGLIREFLAEVKVPGLKCLLEGLSEAQFGIALATSGPIENVQLVLEGLSVSSYFREILTGADVSRGKPHPDVFLLAAERLRLPPEECVVFEDSISGVEAALAANCQCIALCTTHSPEELKPLGATLLINDFRKLTVQSLQDLDPGSGV